MSASCMMRMPRHSLQVKTLSTNVTTDIAYFNLNSCNDDVRAALKQCRARETTVWLMKMDVHLVKICARKRRATARDDAPARLRQPSIGAAASLVSMIMTALLGT